MPDGRMPKPRGWNRIVIEVEDIESTVAALRSRGTTFRNEPFSGPGGTQVLTAHLHIAIGRDVEDGGSFDLQSDVRQ